MTSPGGKSRKNELLELPGTWRPLLWLAMPVMGEQLLTIAVGYTDWWLTGNFLEGTAYKSAMGLMAYALWLLSCLFSAISIGTTALISRFIGAGDYSLARRTMHQAFLLAAVAGVAMVFIARAWLDSFLSWMHVPAEAVPHAREYLSIVIPAVPATILGQVAAASLNGAGDTRIGLWGRFVVVVVNAVVSAGLVTGWGPFPNRGWAGLAIGTACGHVLGPAVAVVALLLGRAGLQLSFRELRPDFKLMRRLLRIGVPGGCDVLAMLACQLTYVSIINRLGTVASAAHGLGLQIESLAYLTGHAFQIATSTMTGQLLGAGDTARAARAVRTGCCLAGGLMTISGVLFVIGGESLASFFTGGKDEATIQGAVTYLKIVSLTMPPLAVLIVLTGALRGAGDTAWPLVMTLMGQIVFRIGLGSVLAFEECHVPLLDWRFPGAGMGVAGAWWGMAADVTVRSVLLTARFLQGGWRNIRV